MGIMLESCGIPDGILWNSCWNLVESYGNSEEFLSESCWNLMEFLLESYGIPVGIPVGILWNS